MLTAWGVLLLGLGAFAPTVESALSGAGWQAQGSESIHARAIVDAQFGGLSGIGLQVVVQDDRPLAGDPSAARVLSEVEALLHADRRVALIVQPVPGQTLSRDGRTAVVQAGAAADSNTMVRAADDLKGPLRRLSTDRVRVSLTGASALWSDFNGANLSAMLRSELLSWPVTLAILVLAFGSLVAAGLPLMLTVVALTASAGLLSLATHVAPVSVWALNFALMFALALGIDYALFIVMRFRSALAAQGARADPAAAAALAADTAGKAVLLSAATVVVSLSAVLLVPSPAFRSMAVGIIISVLLVLAAALTLLPAVLARLGAAVDRLPVPIGRPHPGGSPAFTRWAAQVWRHPLALGGAALALLVALALPLLGLRTGVPSITVVPSTATARVGYDAVTGAFGSGAPGALEVLVPAEQTDAAHQVLAADPGLAAVLPAQRSTSGWTLTTAVPTVAPSSAAADQLIDRLRAALPAGSLLGGAGVENHDLHAALTRQLPLVVGVVLTLGFLLLLLALQAPLLALLGVATNLLAVAAAFGVARLVFQDGHGAALLGFTPQGFLDAWAPIFFFAMIFAISMDYTLFLLSTAKEAWERTNDPRAALTAGLAQSGRTILAAAAVMVAVFLTFALSGPLPPKEMGVVLATAVLLDAFAVRLLLLPVLMRLTGRTAWASPRWLTHLLPTVRFGH